LDTTVSESRAASIFRVQVEAAWFFEALLSNYHTIRRQQPRKTRIVLTTARNSQLAAEDMSTCTPGTIFRAVESKPLMYQIQILMLKCVYGAAMKFPE
jgi:hypothetical protein